MSHALYALLVLAGWEVCRWLRKRTLPAKPAPQAPACPAPVGWVPAIVYLRPDSDEWRLDYMGSHQYGAAFKEDAAAEGRRMLMRSTRKAATLAHSFRTSEDGTVYQGVALALVPNGCARA